MMQKKGFTSIELLVSFVIVSAIAVSLFSVVLNYRNKQQISSYETSIDAYINEITKLVQDDLIKRNVRTITQQGEGSYALEFNKQENGSTTTFLRISKSAKTIQYGPSSNLITYSIPNIPDLEIESYRFSQEGQFFSVEIVFSHPNFDTEKRIQIVSPLNYQHT